MSAEVIPAVPARLATMTVEISVVLTVPVAVEFAVTRNASRLELLPENANTT